MKEKEEILVLKKCSSEWIFEVDADEIITKSLALEVKKN